MGRPVKNKNRHVNFLYGVWTLEEFAQASPRTYGWWLDNIKDFPELAEFSNWATKICNRLVEESIAEVQNGIYILEGEE